MAVDLDRIPAQADRPSSPRLWLWLCLLPIFLILGCAGVALFSEVDLREQTAVVWGTALGVSLLGWCLVYGMRVLNHPLLGIAVGSFEDLILVDKFIEHYVSVHQEFAAGTMPLGDESKENLRKLVVGVNEYYRMTGDQANLYEVAYMLATARHETYQFTTGEYFSEKPEVGRLSYFDKYDPVLAPTAALRLIAKKNGNTEEGDGFKYRGRGCVHLTWKNNYRKFSNLLGFDFVGNPDAAGKFKHAVPIMILGMRSGLFTGSKISAHINSKSINYRSARRVINGLDEADLIASYATKMQAILSETSRLSEDFH